LVFWKVVDDVCLRLREMLKEGKKERRGCKEKKERIFIVLSGI
jgi:hypothetical protein